MLKTLAVSMAIIFNFSVAFSSNETVIMKTGDTRDILLPKTLHARVSRKGIVHLRYDSQDRWYITALRAGSVLISATANNEFKKTIFVDVKPRASNKKITRASKDNLLVDQKSACHSEQADLFQIQTSVEMMDDHRHSIRGLEGSAGLNFLNNTVTPHLKMELEPHESHYNRRIIGDPIVTARPCDDVLIRAGGEDEIDSKTTDGHVVTTWKSHGLDIKIKIVPVGPKRLRIPFSVTLRTPSKGQGSYGVSEVTSIIDLVPQQKKLAAIINMTSNFSLEKKPIWISKVPIIGPAFRFTDSSNTASKLLLWFQIFQNSLETEAP